MPALSAKTVALALLGLVSLVCPLVERAVTGRVELLGPYGLADAFLSLTAIYWWYHLDKQQRSYRAGPLMNVGVIIVSVVALPIYFIRSRGWKAGAITTLLALIVLGATELLSEAGEWLGGQLR